MMGWISGGLIAIQAVTNSSLNKHLSNPIMSAVVLLLVGLIFWSIIAFVMGQRFSELSALKSVPVWAYAGGIIVGFYLVTITYIAPKTGLALALLSVIFGQLSVALVIENFGIFGVAKQIITYKKALGVIMVLAGIYLARG
jgi:bacterial/archaeal transporter family-2 protein